MLGAAKELRRREKREGEKRRLFFSPSRFYLLRSSTSRSSFAAPSATSPSLFPTQFLFQDFSYSSQFPTQLLFQTIYFLSLPIIPGLPVASLAFHFQPPSLIFSCTNVLSYKTSIEAGFDFADKKTALMLEIL